MKRFVVGLIAVLVVAGFWAVAGPDGISNAQTGCASQGAVSPGETALAADCETLLTARDSLEGSARLNWSAGTSIQDWDGISVDGAPLRVVGIGLGDSGLTGTIPTELGDLSSLTGLYLWGNQLTGQIPTELGDLTNLTGMSLGGNELNGAIPTELGDLSSLEGLWLEENEFTGTIPTELGSLANLRGLYLYSNRLSGSIPTELSDLSNLTELNLHSNQLSGDDSDTAGQPLQPHRTVPLG